MPAKQQATPSMVPASTAPASQVAGPSSGAKTASKDKGKGRALPGPYNDEVPAGIPSFEDNPYGYSLAYDDDEYDDDYIANYTAAPTSDTVARVAAILAGTAQTGNSASSSREGGEPAVLHPTNIAEFQLAMEAMDAAHREGNDRKMDLLASLQKVVSLAHKAGKNQSPLEKSIMKAWRVPDWLPATQYDQAEGNNNVNIASVAIVTIDNSRYVEGHLSPWPDRAVTQSIKLCC